MRTNFLLIPLTLAATLLMSCNKEISTPDPVIEPVTQVKKISSSATDYVTYQYNSTGNVSRHVSQWSNSTGEVYGQTAVYDYSNGRLVKWSSQAGQAEYTYQNEKPASSEHFASNGKKLATLHYTFDAANRLIEITEDIANPMADDLKQARITYDYHPNGNISRIDFAVRYDLADAFATVMTKKYVQYDNKQNPEPADILGVMLPGVILHHNNPIRVETLNGNGTLLSYSRYEYQYNSKGLPVQKTHFLGTATAEEFPVVFTYEY